MLKPHGLWFPVDVSTASRATIGGMTANNSCGGRSIRYGTMRDNVQAVTALLADGSERRFGPVAAAPQRDPLARDLLALGAREAEEIAMRFPRITRRVGGYNIDALTPDRAPQNLGHLLVGSEGTLAYFTEIELKLSPLIPHKVMGVCHFPSFYQAMDATQHLVKLHPQAVELVDDTMIALARDIPMFRATIEQAVRGAPAALLLVEFAEDNPLRHAQKLADLDDAMAGLGFGWERPGKHWGGAVHVTDPGLQNAIAEVRKSGLNIMMSMKAEGKPVSFVEDCAVELPDLAEYTSGLTEIFAKHGTRGTWYAHASVGCLHVRPVLNLKEEVGVKTMRAIAEEAFDLVARYKGSHSGEHGDGIVRSEFHARMFGDRMVQSFTEVKDRFDPERLFNPGKIVEAPKMDDRSLFRYPPDYGVADFTPALDWSAWSGGAGGFQGAVEMCNNNGACRKLKGGVMCPSFRATRNERDLTRGRANALRLAITGQLGTNALASDAMAETMKLCVSCKGCKRECPTGVDMARMKIEVQAARAQARGMPFSERLIAWLPRYAPLAARVPWLANARDSVPGLARLLQPVTGLSAARALPVWSRHPFRDHEASDDTPTTVLFADTFNRYFEPENLRSATRVLAAVGDRTAVATPKEGGRPLCCGRTFLSAGLIDHARTEAQRLVDALLPHVRAGRPIIGLEPSCLLSLRDELPALLPGSESALIAEHAKMFEEHIVAQAATRDMSQQFTTPAARILLHGHCHQKAHDVMDDVAAALALLPDTQVRTVETSCCGMAGAFGYGAETAEISLMMAESDLLPAVREAGADTLIIADGTSCRHQIEGGTGREALHVARVLAMALPVA